MRPGLPALLAALSFTLVILSAAGAKAQDRPGAQVTEDSRGLSYEFSDDPLQAGGFSPNDARITVAKHSVRQTLIRPRTHFILEMLKSVENL